MKSKIKDAMVNQLSYLNQSNILDLPAKKTYFDFPQSSTFDQPLTLSDTDYFINSSYSSIFK